MKKLLLLLLLALISLMLLAEENQENELDKYEIRIHEVPNGKYEDKQIVEFIEKETGRIIKTIDTFEENPYNFLKFDQEDDPYYYQEEMSRIVRYKDIPYREFVALANENLFNPDFENIMYDHTFHTAYSVSKAKVMRQNKNILKTQYTFCVMLGEYEVLSIKTKAFYYTNGKRFYYLENSMESGGAYLTPDGKFYAKSYGHDQYQHNQNKLPIFNRSGGKITNMLTGEVIFNDNRCRSLASEYFGKENKYIRFSYYDLTRKTGESYMGVIMKVFPETHEIIIDEKDYDTDQYFRNVKVERF